MVRIVSFIPIFLFLTSPPFTTSLISLHATILLATDTQASSTVVVFVFVEVLNIIPQIPIPWTVREMLLINSKIAYRCTAKICTTEKPHRKLDITSRGLHTVTTPQCEPTDQHALPQHILDMTKKHKKICSNFLFFYSSYSLKQRRFSLSCNSNESNVTKLKNSIKSTAIANTKDLPSIVGFLKGLTSSSRDKKTCKTCIKEKKDHHITPSEQRCYHLQATVFSFPLTCLHMWTKSHTKPLKTFTVT